MGKDEEMKLELRLGPPGEDLFEIKEKDEKDHIFNKDLSLNPFSNASKVLFVGSKRAFFESIEQKTTDDFQQKEEADFLHLQSKLGLDKEMSQRTNGRTDQKLTIEVKKCCLPLPKARSQIRCASTTVVGWPPIRSSRKNLASSSKQNVELENLEMAPKTETICKNFFVKINMEGIPIGRKIDLLAYDCYPKLSLAVDELFRDLLAAQINPIDAIKENVDKHAITGLLDGSGEYTLIYEDDEGDRMLVGDVPWEMFVSTAKRLRVLKSSEVSSSSSYMGSLSRKKKPA